MADEYKRENRIREALEFKGLKQVDLCDHLGFKKSSVNGWIKQNWQPKQEALYRMAQYLEVSEMWLAGYDVPKDRNEKLRQQQLNRVTQYTTQLHSDIDNLTPEQIKAVTDIVNAFKKNNEV